MPKPYMRPPMKATADEQDAPEQPGLMPAQAFGVVTDDGRCPTCGKVVTDVNAEPLDYDEIGDGTLLVKSVVFVVLPCGHDFTREVRVNR